MLNPSDITDMVWDVARAQAIDTRFERIAAAPTADSEGKDALSILMVLTPTGASTMTGDNLIEFLSGIWDGLEDRGDERMPILQYATEEGLAEADEEDEPWSSLTPSI
jgi:hypothetical protein